jgi:hypothetical protein
MSATFSVGPELVEGLLFHFPGLDEAQGFDRLSPSGVFHT